MTENNKYYTPDLEEFHVGFEYEYWQTSSPEGLWVEEKVGEEFFSNNYKELLSVKSIRVKTLDQSDIEELGWKYIKDYELEKIFQFQSNRGEDFYELNYDLEYQQHIIEHFRENEEGTFNTYTIFNGFIKNKNELKKLMTQLNIK